MKILLNLSIFFKTWLFLLINHHFELLILDGDLDEDFHYLPLSGTAIILNHRISQPRKRKRCWLLLRNKIHRVIYLLFQIWEGHLESFNLHTGDLIKFARVAFHC